jgi:hypothetical protein
MVKKIILIMMRMKGETGITTFSMFMEEYLIYRSKHEEKKEQNR